MSAAISMPPPLMTLGDDGACHFTHLKKLSLSPSHYLHSVNVPFEPSRAMLMSTAVHQILLGPRSDKKVVVYPGDARRGNDWKTFAALNAGNDILTQPEWDDAATAAAVLEKNPLIREALDGARTEVPLRWSDNGIPCSTSGVDIVGRGMLGDLKGTHSAHPDIWTRTAFRMAYHCQLVWYRRGAIANGIDCSRGLFVLGYEMTPPYAVVPLELTEGLIDLGERTVTLWLERLKVLRESIPEPRTAQDWPAYVQSPMPWEPPAWMQDDEEDGDD